MSGVSLPECQVLVQDVALELSRLNKRLGKIQPAVAPIFADSPVEIELPERICALRSGLHETTLQLLELAQMAGHQIREAEWGGKQDKAAYPWRNNYHPQPPVTAGRGDAAC